jgi:hypothetical protein
MSFAIGGNGPKSLQIGSSGAPEEKDRAPGSITITQPEQVSKSPRTSGPTQREQEVRQEPRDGSPIHQRASESKEQHAGGVRADKDVPGPDIGETLTAKQEAPGSNTEKTSTAKQEAPAKPDAPSANSKGPSLREQIDERRKHLQGSRNDDAPDERKELTESIKREIEFLDGLDAICDKLSDQDLRKLLKYMNVDVNVRDIPTLVELGVSANKVRDWRESDYPPRALTTLRNSGFSAKNIRSMRRAGFSPADAFKALDKGEVAVDAFKLVARARELEHNYSSSEAYELAKHLARQAKKTGFSVAQLHDARIVADRNKCPPLTTPELQLLKTGRLSPIDGLYYRRANLAITESTIPSRCEVSPAPLKYLGQGAFNKVYVTKYANGDGSTREVAFKPIQASGKVTRLATSMGIDPNDPQFAMRNLASSAIDKRLGFNVIAHTEVAVHEMPDSDGDGSVGLEMARAKGKSAGDWLDDANKGRGDARALFNDPGYWRAATMLQLTDAVTGQADRHDDNYFVDRDANGAITITGIDNDQCFGSKIIHPDQLVTRQKGDRHNIGARGVLLPRVIDTAMADAIRSLTDETLDAELGDKLTPAEIAATKSRVAAIKKHIRRLELLGRVIPPAQWGRADVKAALFKDVSGLNFRSYAHRELNALEK